MNLDADGFPSSLTPERLKVITEIIKNSRVEASDRQDIDFGDDAQVLGMRAYKNCIKNLLEFSNTDAGEFLQVTDPKGRCTLIVDDCSFRVWRADEPEQDAEDKRMVFSVEAMSQISLFPSQPNSADRWAIVYQVDSDKLVLNAHFVGFDSFSCKPIIFKEIEFEMAVKAGLASITEELPQAVEVKNGAESIKLKTNQHNSSNEGSNG
jgi:hypothetical protein